VGLQFELENIDYLRLRLINGEANKSDVYLFLRNKGLSYCYRIKRNHRTTGDEIKSFREIYVDEEDLYKEAKNLAVTVSGETAVIYAEDTGKEQFPGTLEEKVQLAMLIYSLAGEMQDKGIDFS